jgi:hypothetical protein
MSARAQWMATVTGTVAGTGGWILGLGNLIWPVHPYWALLFLSVAVTVFTMLVVERQVRQGARRT